MKLWVVLFIAVQVLIIFNSSVGWDESVYVGIGKFIFSGGEIGLYESFRPSLLPLFTGLLWKLGMDGIMAGKLVVLFFSALNLILFYKISQDYVPKRLAFLGTAIMSLVPFYFELSSKAMTGIVASFFILLSFYFFKKDNSLWGLFAGLAVLARFPAGMFFILFWFFSKKKMSPLILFLIALIPFFAINMYFGSGIAQPVIDAVAHQSNRVFEQDLLFYLREILTSSLFLVFSLFGLIYFLREKKWLESLLLVVPFVYFTLIANKQIRFVNMFLPFILLASIYGFYILIKKFKHNKVITFGLLFFAIFSIIISLNSISINTEDLSDFYTVEKGTYITTDPIFAAYNDLRFIPAYYSLDSAINVMKTFEADYYIYSDVFYCPLECRPKMVYLMSELNKKNIKEKRGTYLIFE